MEFCFQLRVSNVLVIILLSHYALKICKYASIIQYVHILFCWVNIILCNVLLQSTTLYYTTSVMFLNPTQLKLLDLSISVSSLSNVTINNFSLDFSFWAASPQQSLYLRKGESSQKVLIFELFYVTLNRSKMPIAKY